MLPLTAKTLRLPRDAQREDTHEHDLTLPMLTTYTSVAAPVNTNPQQGRGREIRKTALSLGERVACFRRFRQSVSRRTGRAFARRRVMGAQGGQRAAARRRVRGQVVLVPSFSTINMVE
jgi:hypothetical protein